MLDICNCASGYFTDSNIWSCIFSFVFPKEVIDRKVFICIRYIIFKPQVGKWWNVWQQQMMSNDRFYFFVALCMSVACGMFVLHLLKYILWKVLKTFTELFIYPPFFSLIISLNLSIHSWCAMQSWMIYRYGIRSAVGNSTKR